MWNSIRVVTERFAGLDRDGAVPVPKWFRRGFSYGRRDLRSDRKPVWYDGSWRDDGSWHGVRVDASTDTRRHLDGKHTLQFQCKWGTIRRSHFRQSRQFVRYDKLAQG